MNVEEKYNDKIKWGIGVIILLFSIFLFYLNTLYPFFSGDDFIFQLQIPEDGIIGHEKIESLSDLVRSQINFYKNYHYRVINHTLLQAVLLFPAWVFDLLNTLVFLALPWVLLKTNTALSKSAYLPTYLLVLLFIWIFHLNLGWCYFPVTGALNYTWMLVTQLWYIALLVNYAEKKPGTLILILLAFMNSMANENVCIVLFLLTVYTAIAQRKKNSWVLYVCLLIIILGGVFMLSSPSIPKRLATQGHREAGLISHLLEYGRRVSYYFFRYGSVLFLLLAYKLKPYTRLASKKTWLLLACLLAATGSMIIVPLFEPRSAVFGFFLAIMVILSMCTNSALRLPVLYSFVVVGVLVGVQRLPEFLVQYDRHAVNDRVLEAQRGKEEALLQRYCDNIYRDYILCHEISEDPAYFDNLTLAAFYDIDEVKLAPQLVDIERRRIVFDSLSVNERYLQLFNKSHWPTQGHIYTQSSEEGLDLIVSSEKQYEAFYIIRGCRRGLNKHKLYNLLPLRWRMFFLDFLEDTTKRSQESLLIGGKRYHYDLIENDHSYDYLLISEYSFEDHAPVGKIMRLDLD